MVRYLSLYFQYFRLNAIKQLNYRVNFFIGMAISLLSSVVLICFYEIVFEKLELIGTWDKAHAMTLVGSYIIVEALYIGCSFHSISLLPQVIMEGDLDKYLIRPISPRASLLFMEVDFGNIFNVALGLYLVFHSAFLSKISLLAFVNYFIAIAFGALFISNVLFLLMSLAFWLGRVDELRDALAWVIELGSRPAFIYPKIIRSFFYWVMPFFLIANVPVEFLSGERSYYSIFYFGIALVPIHVLSRILWKRGLRRYVSAS